MAKITINSVDYTNKTAVITLSFDSTETSKSVAFTGYAHVHSYWMSVPDWTNVIDTDLNLYVQEGKIWGSGNKAENAVHTDVVDRIVDETTAAKIQVDLSGAAGGTGGDVQVQLFFDIDPMRAIYSSQQ